MIRQAIRSLIVAFFLTCLTGCVREDTSGETHTFTYELWLPLSVLIAGIIAAPAGWFLRKASDRFGWALLILGPIAALFFAPSLFRDRAIVNETTFSLRSGIWGLTAVHEVDYEDLTRVRVISEQVRGRRGAKRTNFYLLCERNNGTSAKVPINNQVSEAAAPLFLERVSERGIPIIDET